MTTRAATTWLLIAAIFLAGGQAALAACWVAGAALWVVAGYVTRKS